MTLKNQEMAADLKFPFTPITLGLVGGAVWLFTKKKLEPEPEPEPKKFLGIFNWPREQA